MLFLSYGELNEKLGPKDIVEVGAKLMEKGLWPVEGVKILGFLHKCGCAHLGQYYRRSRNRRTMYACILFSYLDSHFPNRARKTYIFDPLVKDFKFYCSIHIEG